MAGAKKHKPANGLKSSRKRVQKRDERAPARSAVGAAKKPASVRSAKSRPEVPRTMVAKATVSKSAAAGTTVVKLPVKRQSSTKPMLPANAPATLALRNQPVPKPDPASAKAGEPNGKPKNGKKIVARAAKDRSASPAPPTPVPSAPNKLSRTPDTPVSKWSGAVIRVPPLRKGQKTKPNRAKPTSRSNGGESAGEHDPIQFPEQDQAPPRTPLTAAQLREFKGLLLQKRAELCGDVVRLTDEALNRGSDGLGDQSSMPIHMADLGTDNWEQEFTLGLIANEQAVVREIDQALERIVAKTYGVCVATHAPIGIARLRAKPWAKYCIEYARAREEGRAN